MVTGLIAVTAENAEPTTQAAKLSNNVEHFRRYRRDGVAVEATLDADLAARRHDVFALDQRRDSDFAVEGVVSERHTLERFGEVGEVSHRCRRSAC